jgi:hypothetical protein
MQRKQNYQTWNKNIIALMIMFLVILLPFEIASAQGQLIDAPKNQFAEVGSSFIRSFDNQVSGDEIIGEDIIVNVDFYQPTPISSALLEGQGANVRAILEGRPTNPTIEIENINRITSRPLKVTTKPADKQVSLGSIQHFTPSRAELSYNNLGYIVVPIRRIPREDDVPDEITIDMVSRIYFDVSSGLGFGPRDDVLTRQEYLEWLPDKEKHSFYAGYLRADTIDEDQVTITIYDTNVNELSTVTIKEGSTSRTINTYQPGFTNYGRIFDKFKIRVKEIRGRDDKATFYVTEEGTTTLRTLAKGQRISPDSSWYIDNIQVFQEGTQPGKHEVTLRNQKRQSFIFDLPTDTTSITSKPTTGPDQAAPGVSTTKLEELEKKLEDIQSTFDGSCNTKDKVATTVCTEELLGRIDSLIKSASPLPISIEIGVENLIRSISNVYNSYIDDIQSKIIETQSDVRLTLDQRNENIKKYEEQKQFLTPYYSKITALFVLVDQTNLDPSKKGPLDGPTAFQLAKQSYQQVVDEYPDTKESREALFRLGQLYWIKDQNIPLAIKTFQKLLDTSTSQELANIEGLASEIQLREFIFYLSSRQERTLYTSVVKELEEPDGRITTATLVDIEDVLPDQEASARIRVGNSELNYRVGEYLDIPGSLRWRILSIRDNTVELERDLNVNVGDTSKEGTSPGTRKFTIQRGTPHYPEIEERVTTERIPVQLLSTNLQREVHITIEPAVEQAFSEAYYTLHLPIEKRPFGLPLFSDTLEKEIEKTAKLMEDLQKIIEQATAIHETWSRICYTTYLYLFAKNLLFGGKTTVARNKVNGIYEEKFQNDQLEGCENIEDFEECIFTHHREAYESDIEDMKTYIAEFDDEHKMFSDLGEEYDDQQKTLHIHKRMRDKYPDDQAISEQYLASLQNLKTSQISEDISSTFYDGQKIKDYAELGTTTEGVKAQENIRNILKNSEGFDEQYAKAADDPVKIAEIFDKNKATVLSNYKEEYVGIEMGTFFDELESGSLDGVTTKTSDTKAIQRLRETFTKEPTSIKELHISKIRYGAPNKKEPYLWYNGAIRELEYDENTGIGNIKGSPTEFKFTKNPVEETHNPIFALAKSGQAKDKVEFITLDAFHYMQITYSASGKQEVVHVYRRTDPNTTPGSRDDVRLGEINTVLQQQKDYDKVLYNKITKGQDCISTINRKQTSFFSRGDKNVIDCRELGTYNVGTVKKPRGQSCINFMSPTECRTLFNACDPVICPASRCDFGGEWPVDNVAQSGIIGSVALCSQNFPQVIMPICITGIIAGLQNIQSIVGGYHECLIAAETEGRNVGICDQIRSFGFCEILWKEGIAMFNIKEGIAGFIGKKIFGEPEGGGEYASFQQNFDNSIDTLKYFTQDYATTTFAAYNGGSLPEIGANICRSAIFGQVPGIGNFFDNVLEPESPPQFTATFDETPYSDISNRPRSIYNIFYHIYAGANQDIRFSVYLKAINQITGYQDIPPYYVVRNVGLARGNFGQPERTTFDLPSGYNQICVEVNSPRYGQQPPVCGFGKASTSFFLNKINQAFTESEFRKDIDSEEECTPQAGRLSTYSYQGGQQSGGLPQYPSSSGLGSYVGGAGAGLFAPGLLNTGIVRKCALTDPDIGTNSGDQWTPVGSCGKDDRERDLGTCWLFRPAIDNLLTQTKEQRDDLKGDIDERARKIVEEASIPDTNILDDPEITTMRNKALQLRSRGTTSENFEEAIDIYHTIINSAYLNPDIAKEILLERGKTYEELAALLYIPVYQRGPLPPGGNVTITRTPPPIPTSITTRVPTPDDREFTWYFKQKEYKVYVNRVELTNANNYYDRQARKIKNNQLSLYPSMIMDSNDDDIMRDIAEQLQHYIDTGGFSSEKEKIEFITSFVRGTFYYDKEKSELTCPKDVYYPTQTLDQLSALCVGSSVLTAHLFLTLGYDVGFYHLDRKGEGDNHIAIGVQCSDPVEHSINYNGKKYCYIESVANLQNWEPFSELQTYSSLGVIPHSFKIEDEKFLPIKHLQPILDITYTVEHINEGEKIRLRPKATIKNIGNKATTDLKIQFVIKVINEIFWIIPDASTETRKSYELDQLEVGEEKDYHDLEWVEVGKKDRIETKNMIHDPDVGTITLGVSFDSP